MWKPKFFIVYPRKLTELIKWPEEWGNTCPANLSTMLCEELNVSTIGSELKFLWNSEHERRVIDDYNISYEELHSYLKAPCSMLSFTSKITMKRAAKLLCKLGSNNFICVDSYREVMLQQAYFNGHNCFQESNTIKWS